MFVLKAGISNLHHALGKGSRESYGSIKFIIFLCGSMYSRGSMHSRMDQVLKE